MPDQDLKLIAKAFHPANVFHPKDLGEGGSGPWREERTFPPLVGLGRKGKLRPEGGATPDQE